MRIVVCVEQVYNPKTVKISRSREELDLREAVRVTNPADKYALEAALQLRDALEGEVIVLTAGGPEADDTAREAIAMGADRAVLLGTEGPLTGKGMAALFAAAIQQLGDIDLVLDGEPDGLYGGSAVGPQLAAALGWQLVLDAVSLSETSGGISALVRHDAGGAEVFVPTPAVVVVTRGLDRPRYPHPSRIANAWNEGLVETWTATSLGVDESALTPDMELGGLVLGPERERGQVVTGAPADAAAALVGTLRARRLI